MWKQAKLKLSPKLTDITSQIISVSPWTFGVGKVEPSGNYLSPDNAIRYLTDAVVNIPIVTTDVFAIMIACHQLDDFIQQLQQLSGVLPLHEITKIVRQASSLLQLNLNKMQLPSYQQVIRNMPLSTPTTRNVTVNNLVNQAQKAAGQNKSIKAVKSQLSHVKNEIQKQRQKISAITNTLIDKTATVFVFSQKDIYLQTAIAQMMLTIPVKDAIYTTMVIFSGKNLSALRGMLYE